MSIKDIPQKIKLFWQDRLIPLVARIRENFDVKNDIFIALMIILIGLIGFGLGKLSALEKGREPVTIQRVNFPLLTVPASSGSTEAKGLVVASKSGTKYHFPWCAGASQIADKNKIWFNSYDEARKAGYAPASNCQGLQ